MKPYQIEIIQKEHDTAIAQIIQTVGAEFGAVGDGFGPSDAEVLSMSQYYKAEDKRLYLIATIDNKVVGGCGIAGFTQGNSIAELRKLFLLPKARGLGIGQDLTEQCLAFAQQQGFQGCYLDTLSSMHVAISLYKKLGFKPLSKPLEGGVHSGCNVWMLKIF